MAEFTYDVNDPTMQAILGIQGNSPYTPELTEQSLATIRSRAAANTAANVAVAQSDMMKRGGTGSSTEYFTLNNARDLGTRAGEDEALQWMLGVADRTAEDRRFKTGLVFQDYNTQYNAWNDQRLADQYMTQLAMQQAAERKKARRGAIATGLTSLAGMGAGALLALPTGGLSVPAGAAMGGQVGGSMGFLFS